MLRERVSDLDALVEYYNILTLKDIRSYNRITAMMEKHPRELRQLFCGIGALDAAIAILSFRKSLPFFCLPEFSSESRIDMEAIYHPLLREPVPNSVELDKNSLVSGSNASGKSTFIKATALCGIFAQTIHTCTARRYKTRFSLVMTSMAVRDNILANESYFITEIKSVRRILQKISEVYCTCYIDEILKGTNTVERIGASVSVLKHLHSLDCLCVVATHDIELTQLLSGCYDNFHFCEQMNDNGIGFDYRIRTGPSHTRNAILLLDYLDFPESIVQEARFLVDRFEHTQNWND